MMNKNLVAVCLIAGGVLLTSGCEDKGTKVQYMPDMADIPVLEAQEGFLNPPEGSVPVNAILYPDSFDVAEEELHMTIPKNEENLKKGKELFETFCAVCHGKDGKGDGTLGPAYPVQPPDITRPDLAQHKDGFFFLKITKGGPIMPQYGHATDPNERWQIVLYLRSLQNK